MTWTDEELFSLGWFDADLDITERTPLPFNSNAYGHNDELYHDGYTARWFPLAGGLITCGNRKDLTKKERVHDYVSLGIDTANHGEKGIVEVIVFACSVCGRDWRG